MSQNRTDAAWRSVLSALPKYTCTDMSTAHTNTPHLTSNANLFFVWLCKIILLSYYPSILNPQIAKTGGRFERHADINKLTSFIIDINKNI